MEEFSAEVDRLGQEFISAAQSRLKCAAKDAADMIIKIMNKGTSEKVRLAASIDVLDRNLGKATSRVEVDDGRKDKNAITTDVLAKEIAEFKCKQNMNKSSDKV